MSLTIETISSELFNIIRDKFKNIAMSDNAGEPTPDADNARFFNFDYISLDDKDVGNVTISVLNPDDVKVFYSVHITKKLSPKQRNGWFAFLQQIHMFAKRRNLKFSPQDITRSRKKVKELSEGTFYGTKNKSYQDIGKTKKVKLVINHNSPVDESTRGARSRHIASVFVETSDGERFKMPFTNLTGARAMGNHISSGGATHDHIGKHIAGLVEKMQSMRKFVRAAKNKTFNHEDAAAMVESAIAEYNDTHKTLSKLQGPNSYKKFKESFVQDEDIETNIDTTELKEKFSCNTFDKRMEDALTHVYKAHAKRTKLKEADEYENFMNNIDSSDIDENDELSPMDEQELKNILSKELEVGVDGVNANEIIKKYISADTSELEDAIYALAQINTETDATPIIIDWLKDNNKELLTKLGLDNSSNNHPVKKTKQDIKQESIDPLQRLMTLVNKS